MHWLSSLDPSTRAAMIGACATVISVAIAFVGVVLTIRSTRVRAREDQLITLRREAYLEACDVTAEAVQFLVGLPDPNVTLASGMQVMRRVGGAMGKLHILADQTTLAVVMDYLNAFLDEYAGAAKIKAAHEMNATEINTANQRIALLTADPTLLTNPLAAEERSKLRAQILKLSQDNLTLAEQLIDYCEKIVDKLSERAIAVTLALRNELNLRLDENWYHESQTRNLQLNEARSKPLIEGMHKNLAKIRAGRP